MRCLNDFLTTIIQKNSVIFKGKMTDLSFLDRRNDRLHIISTQTLYSIFRNSLIKPQILWFWILPIGKWYKKVFGILTGYNSYTENQYTILLNLNFFRNYSNICLQFPKLWVIIEFFDFSDVSKMYSQLDIKLQKAFFSQFHAIIIVGAYTHNRLDIIYVSMRSKNGRGFFFFYISRLQSKHIARLWRISLSPCENAAATEKAITILWSFAPSILPPFGFPP